MSEPTIIKPLRVVVAGGGIAALETVLALYALTEGRLTVTLISPQPDLVLRPLAVALPFARGHTKPLPLAGVMAEHSAQFIQGAVLGVDTDAHTVTLATGTEVAYDVLVLAPGAIVVEAFSNALTFGSEPRALNGILADLEHGWSRSVAFVVPEGCSWPLPLYELALMTAEDVWSMDMNVAIHFVTPELEPLEIFGAEASAAVRELLAAANVTMHHGVVAQINHHGRIEAGAGPDIFADRIVALPVLEGPKIGGIPTSANGFIPVADSGLITGLADVYAIGDATDRPIKQGGLACQQADVTAAHIAARAGAGNEVPALTQVLRGRLLTGARDRFLECNGTNADGAVSSKPLWWPPAKVSGRYLAPYLILKGVVHLPQRDDHGGPGVDVCVPLRWQDHHREDILGLSPLGPIPHQPKTRTYV